MKLLLIAGAVVAAIGLFLLASASADTTLFARHYPWLLALNATLAVLLATLVVVQLFVLARRYRARQFGTRLTLRLLARFALLAVVPGMIVYGVSVQFLARSIESWFDVKVDAALEGGINLGRQAIDQRLAELQAKARAMALELSDRASAPQVPLLNRLREQGGIYEAVLVTNSGRLLASASDDVSRLIPELPDPNAMRQARANRMFASIDAPSGRPLSLRVVVPVDVPTPGEDARYLQLRQTVPSAFARSAEAVEAAYRDYRQLAIARDGLKRIYIVTLTFALLMALFVAVGVAVTQSNLLAEPLANLAQATQAVARGDFSRHAPVTSRDELGVLTESFNSMTRQLEEARRVVEANRVALETAKAHLENILANLSTGVLVFDRDLVLSISNHGATAILGDALAQATGRPLAEWPGALAGFSRAVHESIVAHGGGAWQRELELMGTGKTVLVRGAALPEAGGGGTVLVFDDITQLIQAQRATAWAEVARRLAHEIKNPLTPIQLSAERLEMKVAGALPPDAADTLRRATRTIVNQVTALKAMVDDFRDYARLPTPVLVPLELNALLGEVLALYDDASVASLRRYLAPDLPPVRADAMQVRQVIHNLLRNAQYAVAHRSDTQRPAVIEVRTTRVDDHVELSVSDTGGGFPEALMARIFEPYVTTKPRGTGLGLAIVKKIIDEHRGTIAIENLPSGGARVSILFPVAAQTLTTARAA
jgi:nitrogen fixation/metabolism regulation signal transduction histidine kinase